MQKHILSKSGRNVCHLLCMFYGSVHGAEEGAAVLYHTVKVDFVKKVTLSLTVVICVKP